jgi:hypothetical protein
LQPPTTSARLPEPANNKKRRRVFMEYPYSL